VEVVDVVVDVGVMREVVVCSVNVDWAYFSVSMAVSKEAELIN
jgi:hypothetical protein